MQIEINNKKRFEKYYIKYPDGCWRWTGGMSGGYGAFWYNKQNMHAHRAGWMIYKGKIPKNRLVLHKCNHRWCVNPEHLYVGTYSDNINDAVKAGRKPGGNGKLTEENVICIKKMLKDGIKQSLIARIYQVSRANINRIDAGLIWKNVRIGEIKDET